MKVIAYSLFLNGNISSFGKYIIGVFETVESRNKYFPDWTIAIYYDNSVEKNTEYGNKLLQFLKTQKNIELYLVKGLELYPVYVRAGYRFSAMENSKNTIVLFRDLDSPLTESDSKITQEWILSGVPILQYYSVDHISNKNLSEQVYKNLTKYCDFQAVQDGDSCITSTTFAGGGTGINMLSIATNKITIKHYISFAKEKMYEFNQLYFSDKLARGFDEWYLFNCFNNIQSFLIPIVLIKYGVLSGQWYKFDDLVSVVSSKFISQLQSNYIPLLSFVKGKYDAKSLKSLFGNH